MFSRFSFRISLLSLEEPRPGNELHHYWNFDLQKIDAIAILTELPYGLNDDLWLAFCVGEVFSIPSVSVIAEQFQDEWNVICTALIPNPFHPGMLLLIDGG